MPIVIHSSPREFQRLLPYFLSGHLRIDGILFSFLDRHDIDLQSLYYLKRKFGTVIMLDSGAYSILAASISGFGHSAREDDYIKMIVKTKNYERYLQDLIAYIRRHRHILDLYVELDLQDLVGSQKVWEWRAEFKAEGLKPILVWHGEDEDETREMASYTGKFGIPRFTPDGTLPIDKLEWLIDVSKHANWRHGFAYGLIKNKRKFELVSQLNSIDSTAFILSAAMLKIIYVSNNRLKTKFLRKLTEADIEEIRSADPELFDLLGLRKELARGRYGYTTSKLLPIWNAMQIQKYYNRPYLLS